ncbi:MAG: DUF4131 domain-containing protein [Anaerolineae bacterium]|nr:DUF4131 domain-containing protein [Anaerolineae bacterium]
MTLIYLTLAWATGLLLASSSAGLNPDLLLLLTLGSAAGTVLLRRDRGLRLFLLCVLAALLGMLRMTAVITPPGPDALVHYNGQGWQTFIGVITDEPDIRDRHVNLRVDVEARLTSSMAEPVTGIALVQAPRYGAYAYGDRIRFSGAPLTPPEFDDFSYQDYLARRGIFTLVPNARVIVMASGQGSPLLSALFALKSRAQTLIASAVPEPEASLLTGILLGVETGIATEVREAFNATGSAHIIAISGFNMTLIAGLLSRGLTLLWPARRRLNATLSLLAVGAYTAFVGADPAVLRAAVMSGLLILAPLFNRRVYVPASLAFATLVMSLFEPYVLWDVGFQLSLAAILGLTLLATPLENGFRQLLTPLFPTETVSRLLRLLSEPLIVTLAAQITTLPLIALYFGRLSLVSPLANLLILPVQPLLLILGGLATLIGLVAPLLGQPLFWGAWLLLRWTTLVVRFLGDLPGASINLQISDGVVGAFFLALLIALILQGIRPGWPRSLSRFLKGRAPALLLLGSGATAAGLLWLGALALPDGRLHVHFLDTGHSNGVLIQTPAGAHILIDGGQYPTRLLTALGDRLPFWDREIAVLILTQPKDNQSAALPALLQRYHVGQVLTNGQDGSTDSYLALKTMLAGRQIPVLPVHTGYRLETSDGVTLEVLHPPRPPAPTSDPDDAGLVLRLTYGAASFLLTPDLSAEAEARLLDSSHRLASTVLQLPSHGSDRVSSAGFLQAVAPQVAVVQVDPGNRYGHPAAAVLDRLGVTPLYRTDVHGVISIVTDGQTLWITPEHDRDVPLSSTTG